MASKAHWHSSEPWTFNEFGQAFDCMPKFCDDRRLDVPWPFHDPTLLGPSNNAGAHQSTNFQSHSNNAAPESGYGASNLYEDEIGASGCMRPASAAVLKTNGLETIAMGDRGAVCTIPSDQESSPSLASAPEVLEASESSCSCIGCLKIHNYGSPSVKYGSHENECRFPGCVISKTDMTELCSHEMSHYETLGNYKCLEQDCRIVTRFFSELRRHYKKHCTSPDKEIFSCPVLSCKYSGNNGFLRKDKLKSHYRNIHEGKPGPVKASRVIKPATLKPRVSGFGNSPGKQNE